MGWTMFTTPSLVCVSMAVSPPAMSCWCDEAGGEENGSGAAEARKRKPWKQALARTKVVLAAIWSDGVALHNVETALRQSVPQQLCSGQRMLRTRGDQGPKTTHHTTSGMASKGAKR